MSLVYFAASCGGRSDSPTPSTKPQGKAFQGKRPAPAETGPKTPADELTVELSAILNKEEIHFASLQYEYDEGLLAKLDQAEAYLSGRLKEPVPRAMPKLTEQEEYDHLRETIRRWHAQTGKDLRTEIDRFRAEVAARKPGGPQYYPDFHKRFGAVFDSFIPIEVAELRERRTRAIHQAAKPILDKYRATAPDLVKQYEATLNAPPYKLPPENPPEPATTTSSPAKS
jgi:hypothetical protein